MSISSDKLVAEDNDIGGSIIDETEHSYPCTLPGKLPPNQWTHIVLSLSQHCRLIPLDKNLGLQSIGIGETLRRIIGKAVSWTVKAAGTLHTTGSSGAKIRG